MRRLAPTQIALLQTLLRGASKVTILSHTHPDGDAIGSSTALREYLSSKGKDAECVYPDPIPENLKFIYEGHSPLIYSEDSKGARERILSSDLLVLLDANSPSRTEEAEWAFLQNNCPKVIIDHHLNPQTELFTLCFSDTGVSSACELLFWILTSFDEIGGDASLLPPLSARALMTGMTTDTNNFANSTYPTTLEMAGQLLSAGVDREDILDKVQRSFGENRLRILGELLSSMKITPEGAAIMILDSALSSKWGIRDGDTEGFVNIPLTIKDVRLSILVKEDPGKPWRLSLRSKRGVSTNTLASEVFHGGGHENASGGKIIIPDDIPSPDAILSYLEDETKKFLEK